MRYILLSIVLICCGCSHHSLDNSVGAEYIGARYENDPLGEEIPPDNDPLIRFDAFDCTTFVETVLADGDVEKLNQIRYRDGKPNFINRNHFIETDWLKNNHKIVANVSNQYAATTIRNITIDKKSWLKTVHNIDAEFAPQNTNLEYIPYQNIRDIKISKPVIVLFISDTGKIRDKIGTDLAVRHMGFLLSNGILRHASRKEKRVIDVDFQEYVSKIKRNKNNLGIVLLEIKK